MDEELPHGDCLSCGYYDRLYPDGICIECEAEAASFLLNYALMWERTPDHAKHPLYRTPPTDNRQAGREA